MKKTILALVVIFTIGFTFTACKSDKKTDAKEEVKSETASNDEVYQCPMDCEHGKSYSEAGNCPVCKMELKAHKAGESHEDHADGTCEKCGHDTAECTCDKDKKHADASCEKCGTDKECVCDKDKKHADASCEKCGTDIECTCPEDKA